MRVYGIMHRHWGVCTWSKTDRKLSAAPQYRVSGDMRGLRPIATWKTVPDARAAVNATAEAFVRRGWEINVGDFLLFAIEVPS